MAKETAVLELIFKCGPVQQGPTNLLIFSLRPVTRCCSSWQPLPATMLLHVTSQRTPTSA
ncbi:hypothetical protein M9458_020241, partial [Cirrhinus mrigala]